MIQVASLIEDLNQLVELDTTKRRLERQSTEFKELTLATETVRERLPTAILQHYDLRVSKGKLGAAKVRNGICGGCHLSLPSGQRSDMRRADVAIQVCGNCSIFLLPEDIEPEEVVSAEASALTVVKKTAKRKNKATA